MNSFGNKNSNEFFMKIYNLFKQIRYQQNDNLVCKLHLEFLI